MVQSQYSLCWDSYKTSICSGFSALQQNGEFVDLTLAADGHYVKVHQALIAMVSPYLKELMMSAPCQHPIIFLNNISYKTLCLLLEYIYTGEVLIQADNFVTFAEAAKALHIKGIENITGTGKVNYENVVSSDISEIVPIRSKISGPIVQTEIKKKAKLPERAKNIQIKREDLPPPTTIKAAIAPTVSKLNTSDYSNTFDDSIAQDDDDDDDDNFDDNPAMETSDMDNVITKENFPTSTKLQFTVSIRGSLQMILNRYMYNLNSKTSRTGLRRWRCVDYRNNKCFAFVITKGNTVINRANLHNHPYHDKKILMKIEKKSVFSELDEIEAYKEREQLKMAELTSMNDSSMEHENYITIETINTDWCEGNEKPENSDVDVKQESSIKNT